MVETIFDIALRNYKPEKLDVESNLLVLGDAKSGKSSLVQTFLKPNVTKEPKQTIGMDYNFARKKNAEGIKTVAHIWEVSGDMFEPALLDVPISLNRIDTLTIMICVDMSSPQNALASARQWMSMARKAVVARVAEIKAVNSTASSFLRKRAIAPFKESSNPDASLVRPCEVPMVIVCSKFDQLRAKSMSIADRRAIFQTLRFLAHYSGASIICGSITDNTLRDAFRSAMNSICFKGGLTGLHQTGLDKPIAIAAGQDKFSDILSFNKTHTSEAAGLGADESSPTKRPLVEN